MFILLRAALLGGVAYLITRSLSRPTMARSAPTARGEPSPRSDLHPGEGNIWPTSESQERAAANAGPGA